jgi:hypothetical protein
VAQDPAFALTDTARCIRLPHVPITQIGERHGSGKMTLSKGGASGTRIWQCPWFFYPAFCDWLLGRVAVNQFNRAQLYRPDVFSPCYPWLYCTEVSIEGEDLLGVDASLRAFYRRAIVTAKYTPLELNNSIHINSQMLSIPGSQFVFVGQNPYTSTQQRQMYRFTPAGTTPVAGSFKVGARVSPNQQLGQTAPTTILGFDLADAVGPTYWSEAIPYNATPGQMTTAVRRAMGYKDGTQLDAVTFTGQAGGPWVLTYNAVNKLATFVVDCAELAAIAGDAGVQAATSAELNSKFVGYLDNGGGDERWPTLQAYWGREVTNKLTYFRQKGYTTLAPEVSPVFVLQLSGNLSGTLSVTVRFKVDSPASPGGVTNGNQYAFDLDMAAATTTDIRKGIAAAMQKQTATWAASYNYAAGSFSQGTIYESISVQTFVQVDGTWLGFIAEHDDRRLRDLVGPRGEKLVKVFFFFMGAAPPNTTPPNPYNLPKVEILTAFAGGIEPPSVVVTPVDIFAGSRLDQNVGKVVPMGEFTFQRHQVLGADMLYCLRVIGSVNMFTFLGFPPWTLLLTGIEAKQTRLPNGTPAFDMTFKFAFNPHTHQAVFRPAFMRWEFVRGILVVRLPENLAIPRAPLDPANSRAPLSDAAVQATYNRPQPPRVIPAALNPRSGTVVYGPGGIVSLPNAPPQPPGNPAPGVGGAARTTPDYSPYLGAPAAGGLGGAGGGEVLLGAPPPPQPPVDPPAGTAPVEPATLFGTLAPDGDLVRQILAGLVQPLAGGDVAREPTPPGQTPPPAPDPLAGWEAAVNALGDLMSRSIGAANYGTANDDATALAKGREVDLVEAVATGALWVASLIGGVGGSPDGGSGNPEYDAAMLRTAHRCGARLKPCAREQLGLPPETPDEAAAHERLAAARLGGGVSGVSGAPIAPSSGNIANVGGSYTIQGMSTQIFDVGLIYPICDFTPILFLQ